MTVVPFSANFLKQSKKSSMVCGSKGEVGSSKNKTKGSVRSSTAIDTLFLCPPLIPLTKLFFICVIFSESKTCSIFWFISSSVASLNLNFAA